MRISDGRGGHTSMEVKDFRAQVDAQSLRPIALASRLGHAYVWSNVGYDMDAADTILAVRNISPTRLLVIDHVTMDAGIVGHAEHHITNGSAALAGTVVTGVNLNRHKANVAEADAREDETTNSSQGTLIGSTIISALVEATRDWEAALILDTNDSYGIDYVVDDTTSLPLISIFGFFIEKALYI